MRCSPRSTRRSFSKSRAYFRLNAVRAQVAASRDALDRTRAVADAAEARFTRGVANAVERAEARREVAQADYHLAQAQSVEISARAALVTAMGIDPRANLQV